ncbi:uncharacterized protein LOC129318414 isoform X2 [Prosopis cineraria]|uniref:uncharacterized protein LOC129318414 isoform X2 n=1 Tax=Prosopis cineraria TaxID=364024 RepID=UPI00240F1CD8|nr:uncharacterized protein LOC129318414 isoform X2 [Prosopis cineraria]
MTCKMMLLLPYVNLRRLVQQVTKECARQLRSVECGYYMMIFMYKIITQGITHSFEKITQTTKDTVEQCREENYVEADATLAVQSTKSDSRKQSTEPICNLFRKYFAHSAKETAAGTDTTIAATETSPTATPIESEFIKTHTIKEVRGSIVQVESESEKLEKTNPPEVIPSVDQQSQVANAGTSPKLGVCEIFQLVELKHSETALLAQALEQYPQLLLPHEHRSHRMIAWSYRVLVDILVVLNTKTPCTITISEKSTFEANLCDATLLGFDNDWVDSVRARVLNVDLSDVLAAEEEIQVMEAELETCDIALEQVRKQRIEAKQRLAVVRRQLEIAQTEIEAIDSQLSSLLENHKKLLTRIAEFREIISAKDTPFGI